jgi:hypothetical protein
VDGDDRVRAVILAGELADELDVRDLLLEVVGLGREGDQGVLVVLLGSEVEELGEVGGVGGGLLPRLYYLFEVLDALENFLSCGGVVPEAVLGGAGFELGDEVALVVNVKDTSAGCRCGSSGRGGGGCRAFLGFPF